jgi:hypothetical protein
LHGRFGHYVSCYSSLVAQLVYVNLRSCELLLLIGRLFNLGINAH